MSESNENWISLRAFARERGVRLAAVQKAIATGRVTAIKRAESGRITGIDAVVANEQWNANTDLDQAARTGAPLLVQSDNPVAPNAAVDAPSAAAPVASTEPESDPQGYLEARAGLARAQRERAEIDNLERRGELISARAVREHLFAMHRKLRDNLEAISPRLAPGLAAETDPERVEHMVRAEITKALDELSRAFSADAAAGPGGSLGTLQ